MKARGRISPAGGHEAHLSAIAYMSDSYFIGTIARTHKLWRYSTQRKSAAKSSIDEDVLKTLLEMDDAELKRQKFVDEADIQRIQRLWRECCERYGQQGLPGHHHDHDYRNWRDQQMQAFDRDYDEYEIETETAGPWFQLVARMAF